MYEIDPGAAVEFERSAAQRRANLTKTAQLIRSKLGPALMSTRAADLLSQAALHVEATGVTFGAAARRAQAADRGMSVVTSTPAFAPPPKTPAFAGKAVTWNLTEGIGDEWEALNALNAAADLGSNDPARVQRATEWLAAHKNDKHALSLFFSNLSPDDLLKIPDKLAQAFYNGPGNPRAQQTAEGRAKADAERKKVQAILGLLSEALGYASKNGALSADYASRLGDAATDDSSKPSTKAWALSTILQQGTYSEDFLLTIGDKLEAYEQGKGRGQRAWQRLMPSSGGGTDALGPYQQFGYYDPFVGLFRAMGRTPSAALAFLYPTNSYATKRNEYYIRDRDWSMDQGNALGEVLDAAGTAYRDPKAPGYTQALGERSAQAATDAINLLAARKGKPKIGAAAYDSLGHLLASYIADVDFTAKNNAPSTAYDPRDPVYAGMPPRARFGADQLRAMMWLVMTDNGAVREVTYAANQLAQVRLKAAIDLYTKAKEKEADPNSGGLPSKTAEQLRQDAEARLQVAINRNSTLAGYLVGTAGYGAEQVAKANDERAKMLYGLLANAASAVPVPGGPLADFVKAQAIDSATKLAEEHYANNVDAAKDASYNAKTAAKQSIELSIGIELGKAGLLPEPLPDKWSTNGEFDPVKAAQDRVAFVDWVRGANTDTNAQDQLNQVHDAVNEGVEAGRRGRE